MQRIEGGRKYMVILPPDTWEEVERISKRLGKTRAETMRIMLHMGVKSYQSFEAVGVVKLSEVCDQVEELVKEKLSPRQLELFS